jgi:hypothetical protein
MKNICEASEITSKLNKLTLTILLAFFSTSAMAAWEFVGTRYDSKNEFRIYIDKPTIKKTGNKVTVWTLADLKNTDEHLGLSTASQREIDCMNATEILLSLTSYSGNMQSGTILPSGDILPMSYPIVPNTVMRLVFDLACKE